MEEQPPAFDPPLSSSVTVSVPSIAIHKSQLRWRASLPREQYAQWCDHGHKLQVFYDLTDLGWLPIDFEDISDVSPDEQVDFSFTDVKSVTPHGHILLGASAPLPRLVGKTVAFTYRIVDASNSVKKWFGTEQTNGAFTIKEAKESGSIMNKDSAGDLHHTFSWQQDNVQEPIVIANLMNMCVKWKAWGFKGSRPFRSEAEPCPSFGITALALIPEPSTDAYIICSPVMLIATIGTLCMLENNDIILQSNEGTASLHIEFSPSAWTDYIPNQCTPLNTKSPDFLAVSFRGEKSSGYIHLLPLTGKSSIVNLASSDLTSLFPVSSCVAAWTSLAFKVLPLSMSNAYRFATDINGGDIMVISGHTLTPDWTVALLTRNQDRIDVLEPSSRRLSGLSSPTEEEIRSQSIPGQNTAEIENTKQSTENDHSAGDGNLLLLFMYLFQWLMEIALSTASSSPDMQGSHPATGPERQRLLSANAPPRLTYELPDAYCFIAKGPDISQLSILVDGMPVQIGLVQNIGGGHWLLNSNGLTSENSQVQGIEISLRN